MRTLPVLISKASFETGSPPPGPWHALDIPGSSPAAMLVIICFHNPSEGIKWCNQPQCKPLPRGSALVPAIAVTLLGPPFGVTAGDTVAEAMEKVAANWPAAWECAG